MWISWLIYTWLFLKCIYSKTGVPVDSYTCLECKYQMQYFDAIQIEKLKIIKAVCVGMSVAVGNI